MREAAWQVSTRLFLVLAAAFVLCSLFVVAWQAVYIPYWDQWGWLRRYFAAGESFSTVSLALINGHLVAIPGLLYRIDIELFGASNVVNLTVLIACIAGICAILRARFSGLHEPFRGRTTDVYFAATAVLMVWFYNWENLFWPFQVHQYLAILFAMGGLFALSSAQTGGHDPAVRSRSALALTLGVAASLSFGAGLAVWSAAMVTVLLGRWPLSWKACAALVALCVVVPLVWYVIPSATRRSGPFDLLVWSNFVALFLGSPVVHGGNLRVLASDFPQLLPALGTGYLGVALACVNMAMILRARRRRALNEAELFFVGVMVFALSTAVMAAAARSGGRLPSPALSSRYGILCLLFWVSALPLLVANLSASRSCIRNFETVVPVAVLLLIAGSQSAYLEWWMKWRSNVELAAASLASAVPDPEYLGYVFPPARPEFVVQVTDTLLRERISALHALRVRFIGRRLPEFGMQGGDCGSPDVDVKRLPAGYRFSGRVTGGGPPFDEQTVLVTDEGGLVIGIGAVERVWPGFASGGAGTRERAWVAYAPVGESATASVRIHVLRGGRLCEAARFEAPH